MKHLRFDVVGRVFNGVGICGIGITHFLLPGLRPIMAPLPPDAVWPIAGYLVGTVLTVAGVAIIMEKSIRTVALIIGVFFLLFLIFGHLPNRLQHHPEILGYWTDALKLTALAGGAFFLAGLPQYSRPSAFYERLGTVALKGRYLYAIMLVAFGVAHLTSTALIANIISCWIPFKVFWVYLTGIALIGAGLSIFLAFRLRLIMTLLAIMLLIWLLLLHIPSTLRNPFGDANLFISSMQNLTFSGTALLLAFGERRVQNAKS